MSKTNPKYKPVITWLNNLPKCKIFTTEDICNELPDIPKNYIKQIITSLSSKEFYIGKNLNPNQKIRKIDSYFKKQNIPTDKTLEDIKWFLRTGL